MAQVHEVGQKLEADFGKLSDSVAARMKKLEDELDGMDRLMAGTLRLSLPLLPAVSSRP